VTPIWIGPQYAEIASYGGFFAMGIGDAGSWPPLMDCHADGHDDLVTATAHRYGTADRRVAASLVQFSVASRLWSPAIACALALGVVPDLSDLRRAPDSAELRWPEATGTPIEDSGQSAALLYDVVVRGHLEPLAAGLRVKVASGLLYGNAASALVAATAALVVAQPRLRDAATRLMHTLLDLDKLRRAGEFSGPGLTFRRRSCCLFYRTAAGSTCADCGITEPRRLR
jgi:hypothetical protein